MRIPPRRVWFAGLAIYGLVVVWALLWRGGTLKQVLFDGPIGIALVGFILFICVYETLRYTLPFLANTVLYLSKVILPRATYHRFEVWVFARWANLPDMMQRSIWMPRKHND